MNIPVLRIIFWPAYSSVFCCSAFSNFADYYLKILVWFNTLNPPLFLQQLIFGHLRALKTLCKHKTEMLSLFKLM